MAANVLEMQWTRALASMVLIMFCSEYPESHTPSAEAGHQYHKLYVSGHILIYRQLADAIIPVTAVVKGVFSYTMVVYGIHNFILSYSDYISQFCCDKYIFMHQVASWYNVWFITDINQWPYARGAAYPMIYMFSSVVLCFVVAILSIINGYMGTIYPHSSGLLHWHCHIASEATLVYRHIIDQHQACTKYNTCESENV